MFVPPTVKLIVPPSLGVVVSAVKVNVDVTSWTIKVVDVIRVPPPPTYPPLDRVTVPVGLPS